MSLILEFYYEPDRVGAEIQHLFKKVEFTVHPHHDNDRSNVQRIIIQRQMNPLWNLCSLVLPEPSAPS